MRTTICALTALLSIGVQAADAPKTVKDAEWHKQLVAQFGAGTKRALFIAIDDYPPPNSKLGGCLNDAKLLGECLHQYCGYGAENLHVLFNKDATQANVIAKLKELVTASRPTDTLFISFGGHGGLDEQLQSVFCVYDGTVSADNIREVLNSRPIAQKILYVDSCHSGGATTKAKIDPDTEKFTGQFEKSSGLITFAGCRRNQECMDFDGHGICTGQFVRGLTGEADFDKNGIVDSDEIYRHLLMEVPTTAKLVNPKHEQIPVRIIGQDVVGVFALAKTSGKPATLTGHLPARPKVGDVVENSVGMKLSYLPNDLVIVGSPRTEYLRNDDEAEQSIAITAPIYMGQFEVTQRQYQKVMGKNPSFYAPTGAGANAVTGQNTDDFPVEQVTWREAVDFCAALSNLPAEKTAKRAYRLPTECEWEFACRAGTQTVFSTGNRISSKQANLRGDRTYLDSEEGPSLGRTTTVGSYKPNAYGLYDMHGNVAEWCSDYYTDKRFPTLAGPHGADLLGWVMNKQNPNDMRAAMAYMACPQNPTGPTQGASRVYRGGAFTGDVALARSACRRDKSEDYTYRGIGFRVVCFINLKN